MHVLVSEQVYASWRDRLHAVAPTATWSLLGADGTRTDSQPPDIVFLSNDVFYGPVKQCLRLVEETAGLQWLQSAAAGVESPVLRTVIERGGRVSRAHVTAVPIAEYVLQAVLSVFQQPQRFAELRARREWKHQTFREVWRTTWLIVGLGAIGREVAVRARAFDAHVIGLRRSPDGSEPVHAMITNAELLATLPAADVVVIAADLNDHNRHMVDAGFLAAMKGESILVNVARGGLVDESALLSALDRGTPRHAILDVFETEPLPADSPFWDHPQVVMTPHASGGGTGRLDRAVEVFLENLRRFQSGEPLVHEVLERDLPTKPGVWHVAR